MPRSVYDLEEELRKWLSNSKRVVLAGIGNPIRTDDAVGVKIVQDMRGKVSKKMVYLLECETVPENFLQEIMDFEPSHVLLIDAAVLGLEHGDSRLVDPEQLTVLPAYSTHMLPLRLFCEALKKTTESKIALLLVEPKVTEFGEGLTPEIQAAAKKVVSVLLRVL